MELEDFKRELIVIKIYWAVFLFYLLQWRDTIKDSTV